VAVALLLLLLLVVVVVVVVVQKVLNHGISSGMATGSFVLFAVNSSHHFWTAIHIIDILKPVILSATYISTGPSFFWYEVFVFGSLERKLGISVIHLLPYFAHKIHPAGIRFFGPLELLLLFLI